MPPVPPIPLLAASRYVQPLREGGSLPAVVDTDDGLFVVKFRGAGQGAKALVAELIVGALARALALPIPALALVAVDPAFGRNEPDPEIREILRKSHGVNVGLRYLDGAFNFDASAAGELVDPALAARIVWLDAFVTNPDRTVHNPNLLVWRRQPWLIDHGAALYVQHDWEALDAARVRAPFPRIRDHVLLPSAGDLAVADAAAAAVLTPSLIDAVVHLVPAALLEDDVFRADGDTPERARTRYVRYLIERIQTPRHFLDAAVAAREARHTEAPRPRAARR